MKEVSEPRHAEPHIGESSVMRDFVFGFGDGINTSLGNCSWSWWCKRFL